MRHFLRTAVFVKHYEMVAFLMCCVYLISIQRPFQIYNHRDNNNTIAMFWIHIQKYDSISGTAEKQEKKKSQKEVKKELQIWFIDAEKYENEYLENMNRNIYEKADKIAKTWQQLLESPKKSFECKRRK